MPAKNLVADPFFFENLNSRGKWQALLRLQSWLVLRVVNRHMLQHRPDIPRFPCTFCRKYRGHNGFKRKDHLTQHIRNYHHVELNDDGRSMVLPLKHARCPHEECLQHGNRNRSDKNDYWSIAKDGEPPFKTQSALTNHLKLVHDESPFPCMKAGCTRVGGRGYSRKCDLFKHVKREHPETRNATMAIE